MAIICAPVYSANYNANKIPLDDLSRELLTDNGYEIRNTGEVWDKINEVATSESDMPYLLSRLASAKRLGALLQINNIVTRYDAERKLTSEDKEAIRTIARKNWAVFGVGPRNDLRNYFSPQEHEELDKIPMRFEQMNASELTNLKTPSITAVPPNLSTPPPPTPATVATTTKTIELGVFKPWTPPAISTHSVVIPSTIAATAVLFSTPSVTVATVAVVQAKPTPLVSPEQYQSFITSGPYTQLTRELLLMLSASAPDYCLPLLRRTVVGLIPQVKIDSNNFGNNLYAYLEQSPTANNESPVILLNSKFHSIEKQKTFWRQSRSIPIADLSPAVKEMGVGDIDFSNYNSTYTTLSQAQMAGELLEQILYLGLQREGLAFNTYAAKRWANTAKMMFFSKVQDQQSSDQFLDSSRQMQFKNWLQHPDEAYDFSVAHWSSSSSQWLDPRPRQIDQQNCERASLEQDLENLANVTAKHQSLLKSLLKLELIEPEVQKNTNQKLLTELESKKKEILSRPPTCTMNAAEINEQLKKAELLLAESSNAERKLRLEKLSSHAH